MRFAASLVGAQDAGDLVSDAVVATLRNRSLASLDNPQAYLMQAVLNHARSYGRRARRERSALTRLTTGPPVVDPAAIVRPDVARTVADLPLRQRAAVHLVYWEDLTTSHAANLLGVRPATLRRYLHLARQKLRRHLDE